MLKHKNNNLIFTFIFVVYSNVAYYYCDYNDFQARKYFVKYVENRRSVKSKRKYDVKYRLKYILYLFLKHVPNRWTVKYKSIDT